MPGRVAFVPVRFGPQVVGGSEAVTREIAVGLAERSWEVEVLTTRVVDHVTWANDLPEGTSLEDGVVVRRFTVVPEWSEAGLRAQRLIQDGVLPDRDEQWSWVSWRWRAPDLFHHLLRYGRTFDSVVFSPYMFWNATACLGAVDNAVTMPCLHDESYARMEVMRPVLARPRGVWFLSEPEHALAHRLGEVADHHTVTGAGVHVPTGYRPERFRARFGLHRPFVLYAGRREKDKGWSWLLDVFADATRRGLDGVDLLTIGSGNAEIPESLSGRVKDLGFVSDDDRNDSFAAALAYVQPSRMESFSRTIMEAWLAGTPVLAVEGSEVVGWHLQRSGGGVTFREGASLATQLNRLLADVEWASALAERGRRYVLGEYSWPVVLDRIEADLAALAVPRRGPLPAPGGGGPALVVGSYPPIPLPSAQVTVAEVERAWAEGMGVTVCSPRRSAAHLAVSVRGILAGRRLDNVRRHTCSARLVMVAEHDFPVPRGGLLRRLAAAWVLSRAFRGFEHVRLVRTCSYGRVVDRVLSAGADETVTVEVAAGPPGVTPAGPRDVPLSQMPGRLLRRLLGPGGRRAARRLAAVVRAGGRPG
ncbi:MAG TPA: glycosyltransferase [Acidimicrobiales bacterium]|nr:glycosyltransferase [Acidimicrobiales bacterium]